MNAQISGNYELLEWYATSLLVRNLRNFRPLDFCWNEGTNLFYVDDIIIIFTAVI